MRRIAVSFLLRLGRQARFGKRRREKRRRPRRQTSEGGCSRARIPSLWRKHQYSEDHAMRTRAAVAVAAGKPLEIMEVNLEGPK
ncbi:MAG: hypothetical protein V7668_11270, partial [Cereibacter changlensis]